MPTRALGEQLGAGRIGVRPESALLEDAILEETRPCLHRL